MLSVNSIKDQWCECGICTLTKNDNDNKISTHIYVYMIYMHLSMFTTDVNDNVYYSVVIIGAMASQITSLTIVYSTVYSGADQRRSSKTSKLRVTGLCEGNSPVTRNSPHKGPVTRNLFPFDVVIMTNENATQPCAFLMKFTVPLHSACTFSLFYLQASVRGNVLCSCLPCRVFQTNGHSKKLSHQEGGTRVVQV